MAKDVGAIIGMLLLAGTVLFCTPLIVKITWNCIAPLFNGPIVSYWQAFAAWILLGIVSSTFKVTTKRDVTQEEKRDAPKEAPGD